MIARLPLSTTVLQALRALIDISSSAAVSVGAQC